MAHELFMDGKHWQLNPVFQHLLRLMMGKKVERFETQLVRRGDKVYQATEIVVGFISFCIDYEIEPRRTGRFLTINVNEPNRAAIDQHHIFPLVPWEREWTAAEQIAINKAGDELVALEKQASERAEPFWAEQGE